MARWINAQDPSSSIGNMIATAAQSLWGDTLTPALKREQLRAAQRENAGAEGLASAFRNWGSAAAGTVRGSGAGGGKPMSQMADPATSGMIGAPSTNLSFGGPQMFDNAGPRLGYGYVGKPGILQGIEDTAHAIGADPVDLATVISYETGGTFDPMQKGPTTKYGTHEGLIQFGDPQAEAYGATFANPYDSLNSQLGPDGAVARYFTDNGYSAGMPLLDMYSIVNAGGPGRYGASDAANGGAPGTVADKVAGMGDHAAAARDMFEGNYLPAATASPMTGAPATGSGEYNPMNAGQMFGEIASRAFEAGIDPQQAADAARMFAANVFGAENQAATDAFVGAGGDYADTYSGFAANQNRQEQDSVRDAVTAARGQDSDYALGARGQDSDYALGARGQDSDYALGVYKDQNDLVTVLRDGRAVQVRKADILPTDTAVLSDTEVKGTVASGMNMTPEQQAAYVGAEPKDPPTADGYYSAETGQIHRSFDGLTDALTNEPLPPDAVKTSVVAADRATTGLDKLNQRDAEAQVLNAERFKGTVGRAREVATAAGPAAFGIVGQVRSIGQDAIAAINAAAPLFGKEVAGSVAATESALQDLATSGDPIAAEFFQAGNYDPNLTSLQMYARLLPYEAAMAIAGQEGRGLSDSDVKRFQAIVGDPLSFFGSQQAFLTTLDTIETEVNARLQQNRDFLEQGAGAPAAPSAGIPTVNSADEAAYEALPSGTEFQDETGQRWVKP